MAIVLKPAAHVQRPAWNAADFLKRSWAGTKSRQFRSIVGAAFTVGALSAIAKGAGFVKELCVAQFFGAGDALDAYLIAFLIPSFAINVAAYSFNVALIPPFIRARNQQGREEAQKLLSGTLGYSLGILSFLTLGIGLLCDWLMAVTGSGFAGPKLAITKDLFYILLLTVPLAGVSNICSAVLNAERRIVLSSLVPAVTPLITVAGLFLASSPPSVRQVATLTVAGLTLEMLLLVAGVHRAGFRVIPKALPLNDGLRSVLSQYLPLCGGAFLMAGTVLIDQSMAATLDSGSVSAMSYASKLVSLFLTLGSLAIGTAILPHFSTLIAANDWRGARQSLRAYSRLTFLAALPVGVVMVVWARPIVSFLFERGTFTRGDSELVGAVAAALALHIPLFLAGMIGVRLLNALQMGKQLLLICTINAIVNIAGNYVMMKYWGVIGIALSTSIVYFCSCAQIFWVASKALQLRHEWQAQSLLA